MESKKLLFTVVFLVCCISAQAAIKVWRPNPNLSREENIKEGKRQAAEAAQKAETMLQNNMAKIFTDLANATAVLSSNISRASATIAKGITTQSLSLGGLIAHVPRLIFLDGPTQMIEILRLMRTNQVEIPNNMESAIDTMIVFFNQAQRSGAGENFNQFFQTQTDLLNGVGDLVTSLVTGVFSFVVPF